MPCTRPLAFLHLAFRFCSATISHMTGAGGKRATLTIFTGTSACPGRRKSTTSPRQRPTMFQSSSARHNL